MNKYGMTTEELPEDVEDRDSFQKRSVCVTGIYEQLTPEQRERAKNVDLHPINEVRHEPLARQAQLWEAKEALEKAKFSDVISDGEEIFNAIADSAISQVETLIESTKND
jgi:hypothetical protein